MRWYYTACCIETWSKQRSPCDVGYENWSQMQIYPYIRLELRRPKARATPFSRGWCLEFASCSLEKAPSPDIYSHPDPAPKNSPPSNHLLIPPTFNTHHRNRRTQLCIPPSINLHRNHLRASSCLFTSSLLRLWNRQTTTFDKHHRSHLWARNCFFHIFTFHTYIFKPSKLSAMASSNPASPAPLVSPSSRFGEEFNLLSPERIILLQRLQEILGRSNLQPHFVAACFVCDIKMLVGFIEAATTSRSLIFSLSHVPGDMVEACESNDLIPLVTPQLMLHRAFNQPGAMVLYAQIHGHDSQLAC